MSRDFSDKIYLLLHFLGLASAGLAALFIVNNFLIIGLDAPGVLNAIGVGSLMGIVAPKSGYTTLLYLVGYLQAFAAISVLAWAAWWSSKKANLRADADFLDSVSSFVIRFAFWSVLLVGLTDATLSFMRVEGFHTAVFGESIGSIIALPSGRGIYFHIPLMLLSAIIATRDKSVSLIWLAFLVVIAEFLIVIARFIYGYEQTFMGDLVRFWYAALFLFASAYTLKEDGHVRVDVLYAGLEHRTKCILNSIGSLFFGLPLCWLILLRGMWNKTSLINSPMISFETSMSGFGMYIKYIMAAFLVVFAISMIFQFTSYLFSSLADIKEKVAENSDQEAIVT